MSSSKYNSNNCDKSYSLDSIKKKCLRFDRSTKFNNNTVPPIAYITTSIFGTLNDKPLDYPIYRTAIDSQIVPLQEGLDVIPVITTSEKLAMVVQNLYDSGVRFFFGATGTDELISIKSFLINHPDVLWISSASTGRIENKPNNLFRFVTNDDSAVALFRNNLELLTKGDYVVFYQSNSDFAFNLARNISNNIRPIQSIKQIENIPSETSIVWINTDATDVINHAAEIDLSNQLILSDVAAYSQLTDQEWSWIERGGKLYSLTSWLSEQYFSFAVNIYNRGISPLVANMLNIMWLVLDVYKSTNKDIVAQMYQTYGPNLAGIFDSTGDSNLKEIVVVQAKSNREWEIILGQSQNPYQSFLSWIQNPILKSVDIQSS